MFQFLSKDKPVLTVRLDDEIICKIFKKDLPTEKQPTVFLGKSNRSLIFEDSKGTTYEHQLTFEDGWCALSIRLHETFVCQSDCIVGPTSSLQTEEFRKGNLKGIRFQPFYLPECAANPDTLIGRGLFYRGLHFPGNITPGNVSLSCICDYCRKSFRIQSFHAGFSSCQYMYSDSGAYTLTYDTEPSTLPTAPDGSSFSFNNPFRCPHCKKPFIDFEKHPEDRKEYYGNTFFGVTPISL